LFAFSRRTVFTCATTRFLATKSPPTGAATVFRVPIARPHCVYFTDARTFIATDRAALITFFFFSKETTRLTDIARAKLSNILTGRQLRVQLNAISFSRF
jgi:hypothetical protein